MTRQSYFFKPRGMVELTGCLFHPGNGRGFNAHAFFFWKRRQQRRTVSFFSSESCLRASTPFEISRSVEVFRSSIVVFLNFAECDMQGTDKTREISGVLTRGQRTLFLRYIQHLLGDTDNMIGPGKLSELAQDRCGWRKLVVACSVADR